MFHPRPRPRLFSCPLPSPTPPRPPNRLTQEWDDFVYEQLRDPNMCNSSLTRSIFYDAGERYKFTAPAADEFEYVWGGDGQKVGGFKDRGTACGGFLTPAVLDHQPQDSASCVPAR